MPLDNCTALVLVKNDQYWLRYALESTRELFNRYVVYDVGSEDETWRVFIDFTETCSDNVTFITRKLPDCPPAVQGTFRNSMIAEALTDWYFLLDGDELYSPESIEYIQDLFPQLVENHKEYPRKIYGVLWRTEIGKDLKSKYNEIKTHHRIYHRTAIWTGTHPGEAPFFEQNKNTEFLFTEDAMCYHLHNASRSPVDRLVPKRLERRTKSTYTPGKLEPFDLLKTVPVARQAHKYMSPDLKALHDD